MSGWRAAITSDKIAPSSYPATITRRPAAIATMPFHKRSSAAATSAASLSLFMSADHANHVKPPS